MVAPTELYKYAMILLWTKIFYKHLSETAYLFQKYPERQDSHELTSDIG